jgi:hypothetical protein
VLPYWTSNLSFFSKQPVPQGGETDMCAESALCKLEVFSPVKQWITRPSKQ